MKRSLSGWALLLALATTSVAAPLNTTNPLGFFTNVADRLLRSTFNNSLSLTNIPIYPTNNYTPAVHRLLQVTANLYDSTSTNVYPTIFRPYFSSDGTNVFISGYELVNAPSDTNTALGFLTVPLDLSYPANRAPIGTGPTFMNIYGAPWIIGAKKGLPNFNAVAMQTVSERTRMLRISRPSINAPYSQYQTTEMELLGISNVVGVAVWNSYGADYPQPVYVQADGVLSMTLTNDQGMTPITQTIAITNPTGGLTIGDSLWPGWGNVPQNPNVQSFQIPLFTNFVFLPTSVYQQSPPGLYAVPTNGNVSWAINTPGYFPQPDWGLTVTNQIRCLIMDGGYSGRVIDYVQMNGLNTFRDLSREIQTPDFKTGVIGLWSTNLVTAYGWPMPQGIDNQIEISLGNVDAGANWNDYGLGQDSGATKANDIAGFKAFMKLGGVNTNLVMRVPFTPTAKQYQPLVWEVNDPLVHYMPDDLKNPALFGNAYALSPPNAKVPSVVTNMTTLTSRYNPWGGNPKKGPDVTSYMLEIKDPGVVSSDAWDFPSGEPLSFETIGRIHRGTPWQTVYLKANDIDAGTWSAWTGNSDNWPVPAGGTIADSFYSRPVTDRNLISLLEPILSTNNPNQKMSIKNSDINAWLAVLNGLTVQTNSSPATILNISSNSVQALNIAQGIINARQNFPSLTYSHLGDILATPQLTVQSPFLDMTGISSLNAGGLTDEILESLPSQLLPLLREDFFGGLIQTNNQWLVQFTGNDFCTYAVEASSDMVNWTSISTNQPANGVFQITVPLAPSTAAQFYRSVLLP